jgi:pimeloyl-ACP methyl ester carboxylesterase
MRSLLAASIAVGATLTLGVQHASAQNTTWVTGLAHGVKAVLYTPNSNPGSHVGVIIIHRTSNYLNHAGCTELSKRGLTVLCMNSRFDNNETLVNWEQIAQDVGAGVSYLKSKGMTKVILFGHSGGGPTTTYYQAVAENGPSYCQGPNKLSECASSGPDSVAGLPKADGIVLADAHPSNGVNTLRGLNPAINDGQDKDTSGLHEENQPIHATPSLDPFSPANGFNPNGASTFSPEFKARYSRAQAERLNAWIDEALSIKKKMANGDWRFPDDESIVVARAGGSAAGGGAQANLFQLDTTVQCCTLMPEKILKNDGTVVTQMYTTVRLPNPAANYPGNLSFDQGTKNLTVTSFLSANAIRSTDSMDFNRIDWCSSNNSTPCALQQISVPLLITAMGAYYFFPDGEKYFLYYAKSADKTFVVADGLVHGITPCVSNSGTPAGATPNCFGGPYNNMSTNYWNYVFSWISTRFGT